MSDLAGANVFISGGAGFVGSHIADKVLAAGAAKVTVVDDYVRGRPENLARAMDSGKVELIEGDIIDADLIDDAMAGADIVFHQAALRITHCAVEPARAVQVMQVGMSNMLESAVRHKVKRFISASSASVYGEPSYLPMDESHPFNNRTLYGALKIANEQMLRAYAEMHDLPYLAFRPFNVYGPRMDIHGVYTEVMIRWLQRLARNEAPIIFGDGKQSMDFIYVEDLADAYVLAAISDRTDEVYNAGSGTETSLLELAQLLCEAAGHGGMTPIFEAPRKVNPVSRRLASVDLVRDHIGFETTTSLRDGLQRLIRWHAAEAEHLVEATR
jgi:UDP-glucose 4-epimerase